MSSDDGLISADPYATYIRTFVVCVMTLDFVGVGRLPEHYSARRP